MDSDIHVHSDSGGYIAISMDNSDSSGWIAMDISGSGGYIAIFVGNSDTGGYIAISMDNSDSVRCARAGCGSDGNDSQCRPQGQD